MLYAIYDIWLKSSDVPTHDTIVYCDTLGHGMIHDTLYRDITT